MEEEATATGTEGRVGAQEDREGEEGSTTEAGSIEEWQEWVEQFFTGKGAPAKSSAAQSSAAKSFTS